MTARVPAAALVLALLGASSPVSAHGERDLPVAVALSVDGSSWEGDGVGYGALRVGHRWDWISVDFLGRLGYGTVDERMLSYFALGGSVYGRLGRTRPHLRLALVHQHEEPIVAVKADPLGALFGVGDGIRHRGGAMAGAGIDVPVGRMGRGDLYVTVEASGTHFPDPRGPRWYWGAGAGIGWAYEL
jgi:hypothetical protein